MFGDMLMMRWSFFFHDFGIIINWWFVTAKIFSNPIYFN